MSKHYLYFLFIPFICLLVFRQLLYTFPEISNIYYQLGISILFGLSITISCSIEFYKKFNKSNNYEFSSIFPLIVGVFMLTFCTLQINEIKIYCGKIDGKIAAFSQKRNNTLLVFKIQTEIGVREIKISPQAKILNNTDREICFRGVPKLEIWEILTIQN